MPPCNFVLMTGKPCPSCGMTTSFALLVRGDIGGVAPGELGRDAHRGAVGVDDGLGGRKWNLGEAAVHPARPG